MFKFFASGPVYKGKDWKIQNLESALVGRSHRSKDGVERIAYAISLIKKTLQIPLDYHVSFVSGSTTGAMTAITMNLLGKYDLTVGNWDVFSKDWAFDAVSFHDDIKNVYDAGEVNKTLRKENSDLMFSWTSTATGKKLTDTQFLQKASDNINVCDAAASLFVDRMEIENLDAIGSSFQKGLGGEAGLGILIFSPAAMKRLADNAENRKGVPKIFRIPVEEKLSNLYWSGALMNTISMITIEDAIKKLEHIDRIGIERWYARGQNNKDAAVNFIRNSKNLELVCDDMESQSAMSMCFKPKYEKFTQLDDNEQRKFIAEIESESRLYEIQGHPRFSPCFRICIAPTLETEDIVKGLEIIDRCV